MAAPAFASVCQTPCDSKCPKANGTPVCEPLNFAADAAMRKGVLSYGESMNASVTTANLEKNVSLSCEYSFAAVNRTAPVAVPNDGIPYTLGTETVTAPTDVLGYRQLVPLRIDVYCSSRLVNVSDPAGNYLWCGAGCASFTKFYTYPTGAQAEQYQLGKLNASNALTSALKSMADARSLIASAKSALASAQSRGVDTAFAEAKLQEADAQIEAAMQELGLASYAFDQSDFPGTYSHVSQVIAFSAIASSRAAEAYATLVYTPESHSYLQWYLDSTGIIVDEITDLLDAIEPVVTGPGGPMKGEFAMWQQNLTAAKGLIEEAKERIKEGDIEGAKSLLQKARDLLMKLRQAIESAFDRMYTELLKAVTNDYLRVKSSVGTLYGMTNSSFFAKSISEKEFKDINSILKTADASLGKAEASIRGAEGANTTETLSKEVRAAFAYISNARVNLIVAMIKYRLAAFRTESLVVLMTVASALVAAVLMARELIIERRKRRLAIVKNEVLGAAKGTVSRAGMKPLRMKKAAAGPELPADIQPRLDGPRTKSAGVRLRRN